MTSQSLIRSWLDQAASRDAKYMLVVCDQFDYEDFPVYALTRTEAQQQRDHYTAASMRRVMEVYDMSMPIEAQLQEQRAYHLD